MSEKSSPSQWIIHTPDNDNLVAIAKAAVRSGDHRGTFNAIARRTEALAEGIRAHIRTAGREDDARVVEVLGATGTVRVACDAGFADQLAKLPGANGKKQPAVR